jgi:hypothetical protein
MGRRAMLDLIGRMGSIGRMGQMGPMCNDGGVLGLSGRGDPAMVVSTTP